MQPNADATSVEYFNTVDFLRRFAASMPDAIAVAQPLYEGRSKRPLRDPAGKRVYSTLTFAELDQDSDRIAAALQRSGVKPGDRLALMVRQGVDFVSLVFALYKSGAVLVLIDPGMGIKRMLACLRDAELDGFIAIPQVQAARVCFRRRFPKAKKNLTVGRRWFWRGLSLDKIRREPFVRAADPKRRLDDAAAIIFTSGSTGVAKGVLYTHRMFKTQVEEISKRLDARPGGVDLVGFPFFGLFDAGMGATAVIPDMDSTRPASVDPRLFLEAADDWQITQAFGSPALWNRVVDFCLQEKRTIPTLKRAAIAGAPVSFKLLEKFRRVLPPDANIFTPYGATESLPLAMIESREVLEETSAKTRRGAGICVGRFFDTIERRVIPVTDAPIPRLEGVETLGRGEIGELLVSGPQVSPRYVTRLEANELALVFDKDGKLWRRVGDVGYIDDQDRFWFCGRKSHRVETAAGPMFTIPCEAISNESPKIYRSALVGVPLPADYVEPAQISERAAANRDLWREPVMVVEPFPNARPENEVEEERLCAEILELLAANATTAAIRRVLICPALPVDVRHNAKINREDLAVWAAERLSNR